MNWQRVMDSVFNTLVFLAGTILLAGAIYCQSAQMAIAGSLLWIIVWLWRIEQLLVGQKKGGKHRVA